MPQVVQDLAPYLNGYGYLAVFGAILLEDFGVPMPGETMLIAGSLFAALGRLDIVWVLLLAFTAAVTGDNIGFAIGHFGGRRVVLRFGRYIFLTEERLQKVESFFDRHGGKVVTVARFIEGLRQLNGIAAGTSGMEWRRFVAFNALGALLWVGFWGGVGYFFGDRLAGILSIFKRFEVYFLVVIGAILVFFLVRHLIRNRREKEDVGDKP